MNRIGVYDVKFSKINKKPCLKKECNLRSGVSIYYIPAGRIMAPTL